VNQSLSTTIEPTPAQLAGVLRTVARAAERDDWPLERVQETLAMLGFDSAAVNGVRLALRRSLRARRGLATIPVPGPALRASHATPSPASPRRAKPRPTEPRLPCPAMPDPTEPCQAPATVAEPIRAGTRNAVGKFVTAEVCSRSLHVMSPENVIIRPDKVARQCKACTYARRKVDRLKAHRRAQDTREPGSGAAASLPARAIGTEGGEL
jgi:hypothetical protein